MLDDFNKRKHKFILLNLIKNSVIDETSKAW